MKILSIISGTLAIINFFLADGKKKIRGTILLILFALVFLAGAKFGGLGRTTQSVDLIGDCEILESIYGNCEDGTALVTLDDQTYTARLGLKKVIYENDSQLDKKLFVATIVERSGVHASSSFIDIAIFKIEGKDIQLENKIIEPVGSGDWGEFRGQILELTPLGGNLWGLFFTWSESGFGSVTHNLKIIGYLENGSGPFKSGFFELTPEEGIIVKENNFYHDLCVVYCECHERVGTYSLIHPQKGNYNDIIVHYSDTPIEMVNELTEMDCPPPKKKSDRSIMFRLNEDKLAYEKVKEISD